MEPFSDGSAMGSFIGEAAKSYETSKQGEWSDLGRRDQRISNHNHHLGRGLHARVGVDGKVSPCMGLLHTHKTYLNGLERTISAYTLGDVGSGHLYGIWNSDEYARFREKVRGFLFSPCHVCGGCSFLEKNEEDCCGNTFPVCGGCLWAQGVIQCP